MNKIIESKKIITSQVDVSKLVTQDRPPFWLQLNKSLLNHLYGEFNVWPARQPLESIEDRSIDGLKAQIVVEFLVHEIKGIQRKLKGLNESYRVYSQRYLNSVSEQEKQAYILAYAKELGASRRKLHQDKKSFKRWFGHDAVCDRYKNQYLENERYLSFVLECLGKVAATVLRFDGEMIGFHTLWQRMALESVLQPLLNYDGDERVVTSAFKGLSQAIYEMPREVQYSSLHESSLRFIYQAALKNTQSVWVQCEALQLIEHIKPEQLPSVLSKRFAQVKSDEDLFVRRKAVEIIGAHVDQERSFVEFLDLASKDTSPAVRQKVAEISATLPPDLILVYWPVLLQDESEAVRASALLGLVPLFSQEDYFSIALQFLQGHLQEEQLEFPIRTGFLVCRQGLEQLLVGKQLEKVDIYLGALLPVIEQLHQKSPFLSVRRWAGQTREYLLCLSEERTYASFLALQRFVKTIKPGKTKRLPKNIIVKNDAELARVLSVIAQQDFGFDIEKNIVGDFLTRGHSFGFRLWRFLHELRHSSSDKRQGFSHTIGRLFWGELRIPSAILSELAETKVPGEPLFLFSEGGWREYLPLLDEVLSALSNSNKATKIYHSEGVTTIQPPRSVIKRWRAQWVITSNFEEYARLRNWEEQSPHLVSSYFQALAKLDIHISYVGHQVDYLTEGTEDPAVLRFFPALFPIGDGQLWSQFKDYFISVYENSLYELAVYITLACAYFAGRHVYLYQKIKLARNRIPLVVGGWGTRGKSGTERMKAAVINALGHSVISKTTGCEAMFIHGRPFGELREMFLFRPYDKATIWEQHNLVCMAGKFNTEVFLWECMGLTPAYIDVLQHQWMRDDIATITNTYPDHEDLQGPAGVNIPEVMTKFIPKNAIILTSEEQMRPILEHAAQEYGSKFRSVGWLQAGLLTQDILERFPYDEHPYNIALVLAVADELGVEYDFALKEMADRVIPDIGVLKTYPCAPWRSRQLEFINGMSANERFGCLGNWQRMGLDRLTLEEHPSTWVVTVVNNRADRVPRSQVFASILVKDIGFDRCVLIGNNLTGMQGYIKDAWKEWVSDINMSIGNEEAGAALLKMARWFRIPYTEEMVKIRLELMLAGQEMGVDIPPLIALWDQPEALTEELVRLEITNYIDIISYLNVDQQLLASYQQFLLLLTKSKGQELNIAYEALLWQWFQQKIVVVEDYSATGNQVIEVIGKATPPGFYARIMGMQNIKGTGLDFVYRWQAWESCYHFCQQLASTAPDKSIKGLAALAAFQEYGLLAEETVRTITEKVKSSVIAQNERYQAELALIIANLNNALNKIEKQNNTHNTGSTWKKYIASSLEAFLDAGDAVQRRKQANIIYEELVAERISHEQAAIELQVLNARQKGGWLSL